MFRGGVLTLGHEIMAQQVVRRKYLVDWFGLVKRAKSIDRTDVQQLEGM